MAALIDLPVIRETLKVGEVSFKARLALSHEDATSLLEQFQNAHAGETQIAPDLEVTARISPKGVQSAELLASANNVPKPSLLARL